MSAWKAWSAAEIAALRQQAASGYTIGEAARELALSYEQVRWKAKSLGIEFVRQHAAPGQYLTALTRGQKRMATLIACGMSDAEIGSELALSPKRVRNRLVEIMNKTGCHNRTRLALWALHEKLISVEEAWNGEPAEVAQLGPQ